MQIVDQVGGQMNINVQRMGSIPKGNIITEVVQESNQMDLAIIIMSG
jgi:hypothetical protein